MSGRRKWGAGFQPASAASGLEARSPSVRLHIDRLVLDGVNVRAADRPRLQAAIESELARLIATGGISPELADGVAVPSVRAPQIALSNDSKQLGTSIAGAVYGGVGIKP